MRWRLRFKPSIRLSASMRIPWPRKSYAIRFLAILFGRKKTRSLDENAQKFIAAQRKLRDATLRRPDDPNRADAISKATAEVNTAKAAVTIPNVTPNREKPWGFWAIPWGGPMKIATAIRPGEIYRVLQEMREMTPEEAQLLDIPKELT